MNYEYKKISENGDATCNYNLIGKFPVRFIDFVKWVLKTEKSFRVVFHVTNKRYGGWFGNSLEIRKTQDEDDWYVSKEEPFCWLEEVSQKNVTRCWANGGYGQMSYHCTFEED